MNMKAIVQGEFGDASVLSYSDVEIQKIDGKKHLLIHFVQFHWFVRL